MTLTSDPVPTMPRLTIIIPTHAARGFLTASMESAVRSLQADDELLIVANGASADYLAALGAIVHAPARLIVLAEAGVTHARNAGLREATGAFVLFLDDDDLLIDGGVTALREALHAHPTWIGVAGTVTRFDDAGEYRADSYGAAGELLSPLRLLRQTITTPGAVLLRAGAVRQLGGFDETTVPVEDFDLWLRMAATAPLAGVSTPVLRYRVHPAAMSANVPRMAARALAIFRWHARAYAARRVAAALRRAAAQTAWYYRGPLRGTMRVHLRTGNWRGLWVSLMLLAQFRRLVATYRVRAAIGRLLGRARDEPVGETDALAFPYLVHSTSNDAVAE